MPAVEEQQKILECIELSCSDLNTLINKYQQQIDLIQEYRTRLISDVVIGQIDVRNIDVSEIIDEELIEEVVEDEQEDESLELAEAGDDD